MKSEELKKFLSYFIGKCRWIACVEDDLVFEDECEDLMNRTMEKARHKALKKKLKFLKKLRKILNNYHSQIPMVEIGRQNVLDDINNELKLDERIAS